MNKNTIALLAGLVLMGAALFAMADYQHGKALPPKSAAAQGGTSSGGGLVINGLSAGAPPAAAAESAPASNAIAPLESAAGAATCP